MAWNSYALVLVRRFDDLDRLDTGRGLRRVLEAVEALIHLLRSKNDHELGFMASAGGSNDEYNWSTGDR